MRPITAPKAYISLVAGSKYDVTICVASVISTEPLPYAIALMAAMRRATAEKKNLKLLFVITIFEKCRGRGIIPRSGLILFNFEF
jgi:hypothetical protein